MTLVNTLYSLAVGLLFGVCLCAIACAFPSSRPLMVVCWRLSPVGTILACVVLGLLSTSLFIIFGWWILVVTALISVVGHLSTELAQKRTVRVERVNE